MADHVTDIMIINRFDDAVKRGYIKPYFQPIYRSVTGKIACAEALARWDDPELGMLAPAVFIPALEGCGKIYDLDMEILRQTCEFYAQLRDNGTLIHSFSVNLSRHDFVYEDLFERVGDTLKKYDVPHDAIKLEITESLMVEDIELFRKIFHMFSEDGYSIWMDDFGSGYSSLNMLQNYSFDMLKLDMMFLQSFSMKSRQVLASVVNMAKTLGIHTLTEGVETEEQKNFLQSIGCETLQGFLYSKPMPAEDLKAKLDNDEEIPESLADRQYWNTIGSFNYLNANPLEEFAEKQEPTGIADYGNVVLPLALLECGRDKVHFIYASGSFMKCIHDLGFSSLEDLESVANDKQSDQHMLIKKLIADSIESNDINTIEYANNDVYFRLSSKCLVKSEDRAMLAMRLSTFDSEKERRTAREMLYYSNTLFTTYELVVLFYPGSNSANRIYNSQNLPIYDREETLHEGLSKFCKAQVDPIDQERYMKFLDFTTLGERLNKSPKGFIQDFFRMKWGDGGTWYTARVSNVSASEETTYILTIQSIQGNGEKFVDLISRDHSELLEN